MRKLIAAINMTLDGFCDHTVGVPDHAVHQHYAMLVQHAGLLLYGRIVYQLMESHWPGVAKNPTGNKATDDFAVAIENVPKLVFSRTLTQTGWKNTTLAKRSLEEEVRALKQQPGGDILVGSPSLVVALTDLNLLDQYQLFVHPVVVGHGLPLFKNLANQHVLNLVDTKTFPGGHILLYYEPAAKG